MTTFTFDKNNTFCINLLSRPDRWHKILNRCNYINIDITRWNACTENDVVDIFEDTMSLSERACAQSHINLWRHIVENNLPYAFIIEDDAIFDKKICYKIQKWNDTINDPDWDMILLNSSEPETITNTWVKCKRQYMAGGYIISNKCIKDMLEFYKTRYERSDWMLVHFQNRNHSYAHFPWCIIQEDSDSNVNNSTIKKHHSMKIAHLNSINYYINNYVL